MDFSTLFRCPEHPENVASPRAGNRILFHRREYDGLRALLLEWRTAAELSQRALAAQLGKSLAWVNRCETGGRRMDPLEWLDWAGACGVKPEDAARQLVQRR